MLNQVTNESTIGYYISNDDVEKWTHEKWCMYFWIPQEIHMKKGKMAGQVAHASARLARLMSDEDWESYIDYEVKIVYKVPTTDDMFKIRQSIINEFHLIDIEYETMIFDNTWEKHTVFGIASKLELNLDRKWRLA